ncbi:MAG: hypothetical protein UY44_C0023G0006 [Candidatus Kaiserbacteria bacterium GW2011_GWA2_49_19]|uniref:Uncharacterized protein n=1 Tax=Candidatus Kaiserbacteria bacterium GW2011_GWA2_49_19 TaxID=1618669 RepID=A0A0G1VNF3_9BACT|nr:MAG: hypothetical protein UY44_C0023G0006 [Candidatus Kaiserbacteria bacterium GW2011_GWA2_49_19]
MLKEELKQKILSELQQYPQRQYIRRLALLGRPVDLVTEQGLSRYFRDRVIKQAEVVYGG